MKITNLGYAILGLLAASNRSGYAIRKVFEETALGTYSSTPGSIYPALNKLEALELVKQEPNPDSPSAQKKLYAITEEGFSEFLLWLSYPEFDVKDMAKEMPYILLRFSMMSPHKDVAFIKEFLLQLQADLHVWKAELEKTQEDYAEHMSFTGAAALNNGVMAVSADINWVRETLNTLENKKGEDNDS